MPRRPSVHNAISPSNTVNEVLGVLSRKLNTNQIESTVVSQVSTGRRGSFTGKMDQLLHPVKKAKERDGSRDRELGKDKKKHLSIRHSSKPKDSSPTSGKASIASPGLGPSPGKFEMIIESPPALLHGSVNYSSGALIAGRLKFNVETPSGEVTLTKFNMVFQANTTTKRPVSKECGECLTRHEVLKEWKFLSEPKSLLKMKDNQFPWSLLLEGRLPATTSCQLGSIAYEFVVRASTDTGEQITFRHPLLVSRAIPPGPEKGSIRIFPPTNLTGRVTMQPVVHPIGKFPVSMSLTGIVDRREQSQTRWRLKKMMWRIEEHSKIKSTPCEKHKNKVSEGKALQYTDSKQLGNDEMKSGWKTDFDTAGGEVHLEFEASLATKPSHKPSCDVESQSGLEVKHILVIELIVAEEFVPNRNTNLITPTGAARVLRMQFALVVTERGGMGISWDDEMPPMYEDVPPSPPGYGNADKAVGAFGGAIIEDYEGPELDYVDLERVPTVNPSDPPMYRERDFADVNTGLPMRSPRQQPDEARSDLLRQRLGGFRLDELEAEPSLPARRRASDESAENDVDYGEGEAS